MKVLVWIVVLTLVCPLPGGSLQAQVRDSGQKQGMGDESAGLSFRAVEESARLMPGGRGLQLPGGRGEGLSGGGEGLIPLIYQAHVVGAVRTPGTYRISASNRLDEVLELAGGLTPMGSGRNVEIRREGRLFKLYDLRKFKDEGDLSQNPYLQDNDVAFVPFKKNAIEVVGAVKRPGEYEMRNEKTVGDVLKMAGGFAPGASKKQEIHVVRFVDEEKKVFKVPVDDNDINHFSVEPGDVVYIPHVLTAANKFDFGLATLPADNIFFPSFEDRVFVVGEVGRSGAYQFSPYYSMSQYLALAGGPGTMAKKVRYIIRGGTGKKIKVRASKQDEVVINPGDTILLRKKKLDALGWISFVMTLTGFTTGTILSVVAVKNL